MTPPLRSSNPANYKRSLHDRIKNESKIRGRTPEQLQREFHLQRFLTRVFTAAPQQWLLKGGASLLIRRSDARYSEDIDLLYTRIDLGDALDTAVTELTTFAGTSTLDPFRYVLGPPSKLTNIDGAKIHVDVYLGAIHLTKFPVDLSTGLQPIGETELQTPRPVVTMDELAPMPDFALYPLPQQIADKVCAMYEKHGTLKDGPSTRYHDLVDLVLIVSTWFLDAATTRSALIHEAARRNLTLPRQIQQPGTRWDIGYPKIARLVSALNSDAKQLADALNIVGTCLNPLLSQSISTGQWNPSSTQWTASY